MSRHTIVAIFLVACCCYGTTLVAKQRSAAESAAAAHARTHKTEAKIQADARDHRLQEQAPAQADVPVTEA